MDIITLYKVSKNMLAVGGYVNDLFVKDHMAEMLSTIERSRFLTAIKALEDARYSRQPEKEYRTAVGEVRGAYITAMERARSTNIFQELINPWYHPWKAPRDAACYALIVAMIYKYLLNETGNAHDYIDRAKEAFEAYKHDRGSRSQQAQGSYQMPIDSGAYERIAEEEEALQEIIRLMF